MPYLDKAGTEELWSKIKSNFAHDITITDFAQTSKATISLNSGMKNSGNWVQLSTIDIPVATNTSGGLVTAAQARSIASIQTYTAGTNISISGGQISVTGLAKVATTGSYSDLSGTPTIDTSITSTSTNAVTNKAISTALSGKAEKSHKHTQSDISDFPTSLKNPNALTIYTGYTPDSSDITTDYDGSTAEAMFAMYGGVVIQYSWDYDDITTALDNSQTPVLKAYYTNIASEPTWVYLSCNGLHESQSDTDTTFYIFNGMDWHGNIYIATCAQNCSVDSINNGVLSPLDVGLAARTYLRQDTASSTYAPLASPTFTDTPSAPTAEAGTNTTQIATTEFVQAAIKASGAGTVHYKGAAESTAKLVDYVTGDYWVASATFALGDETVESGDMIFANKTASAYAAANFDVVQANITAMTTTEVDAICKLD